MYIPLISIFKKQKQKKTIQASHFYCNDYYYILLFESNNDLNAFLINFKQGLTVYRTIGDFI